MVEISTSILTVEKEKATKTFYDLEVAGTDYYHIDIMDGKFVEKNTEELMYEYASTIKQISNLPLDVHLMVEDIKPHIEKYIPLEPSIITFHYEACKNKEEILEHINCLKQNNIKPAISIKPKTLIKVKELKKYIEDNNLDTYIEVDGGINKNTINEAKQAGIDIAVAGSAIISAENFKTAIAELK